jgi:hypothetical protein
VVSDIRTIIHESSSTDGSRPSHASERDRSNLTDTLRASQRIAAVLEATTTMILKQLLCVTPGRVVLALLLLLYNHPANGEIMTNPVRHLQGSSNDFCETAEPVSVGRTFFANLSFATPDDIGKNCTEDIYSVGNTGVWFRLQGTGERLFARSCGYYSGAAKISVFTGDCTNLKCVAGQYGLCRGKRFMFDTIVGTTYSILIQSYFEFYFDVTINVAPPAPVANDVCENASPIAIGSKVTSNVTFATSDALTDDCTNEYLFDDDYPGVWYSFVGTGERLVARSCSLYPSTNAHYITITILEGGDCNLTNLKCVAATSEPCAPERFSFDTVQGKEYYVLLRSDRVATDNESIVEMSLSVAASVENDFCGNAQPMSIGSTVYANLSYATAEKDYTFVSCVGDRERTYGYPDVWYTFVGNGKRLAGRLGPFCNRSEETAIAIFSGGCDVYCLTCVAGTSFLCRNKRLLFQAEKGTRYHVLVQTLNADKIVDLTIATCGLFRLGIFCPLTIAEFLSQQFPCLFGGNCCVFESC